MLKKIIDRVKAMLPSARLASLGSLEEMQGALERALADFINEGDFIPLTPLKKEEIPRLDVPVHKLVFPDNMDSSLSETNRQETEGEKVKWMQWTESIYKNMGNLQKEGVIKPLKFSLPEDAPKGIKGVIARQVQITPISNNDNARRLFASIQIIKMEENM